MNRVLSGDVGRGVVADFGSSTRSGAGKRKKKQAVIMMGTG
jgi:hypothetical protein